MPSQAAELPPDQAGNDPLSPTTLIYNYLRQQGMPLTGENVSRALQANATNPGTIQSPDYNMPGAPMPIPMVNDVPSVDQTVARGNGSPRTSAQPTATQPPSTDAPPAAPSDAPPQSPDQAPTGLLQQIVSAIFNRTPPPQPSPNYSLSLNKPPALQLSGPASPQVEGTQGKLAGPKSDPMLERSLNRAIEAPSQSVAPSPLNEPIIEPPFIKHVIEGGLGAARGGMRGGAPGAAIGALMSVAPELAPYILRNLPRPSNEQVAP